MTQVATVLSRAAGLGVVTRRVEDRSLAVNNTRRVLAAITLAGAVLTASASLAQADPTPPAIQNTGCLPNVGHILDLQEEELGQDTSSAITAYTTSSLLITGYDSTGNDARYSCLPNAETGNSESYADETS
ncbi:hypothetical protein ACH4SP_42390 [Streptomyces sp. NPDC021093]|uniref:hypothetical protein n=1 Tax=Streptomyces sp. NPDC021093 TaxID=3365112 RepID=UPI00379FDCD0